jgi:hypothetical protein
MDLLARPVVVVGGLPPTRLSDDPLRALKERRVYVALAVFVVRL